MPCRKKAKRRSVRSGVHLQCRVELPHAIALMRAFSRETRRDAAFLAITRASAPRWISGCAAFSASAALLLVAGLDRVLDLLDRAAHAAAAHRIRGGAALGLAGALLGRLVISHSILFLGRRRLYEATGSRSTPCNCREFSGVSRLLCASRRRRSCLRPVLEGEGGVEGAVARSARLRPGWSRRRG